MRLWEGLRNSKLFENLKKIWLRVKGQNPDLLAKIDGLLKEIKQYSDLIQKMEEELTRFRIETTELKAKNQEVEYLRQAVRDLERTKTELITQIEKLRQEIEEDRSMYEELKRIWIEFLVAEKAGRWKEKNRCQGDFIEFCRRVIPLDEEDITRISKEAEKLGAEKRRNSIVDFFRRTEKKPER